MPLKAHINFVSPLFKKDKQPEYRTSIQLMQGGLSYAVVDIEMQQLMHLKVFDVPKFANKNTSNTNYQHHITQMLDSLLKDSDLALLTSQKLSLVINSPIFTLIPNFFIRDDKDAQQHLSFGFAIPAEHNIYHYSLLATQKQLIMAIPDAWLTLIQQTKHISIHHPMGVLYQDIQNVSASMQGRYAMAYVNDHLLFLSVYQDKELLLSNSYTFHTKEDFIYYILLAYKILEMDTNENKLYLLGQIGKQSQLFDICWKYVRYVDFFPSAKDKHISINANLPAHQYYILTQTALCE